MSPSAKPLLIVDDDTGLLRQLRWAFSDHKVHPAETRLEAIDLVRKEPVPVAIVDLGLPPDPDGASEGLATLAEILAIAPATKVIIATGNETREHALQAIALGAYDFYQKPIDIDVLQVIVGRAEHSSSSKPRTAGSPKPLRHLRSTGSLRAVRKCCWRCATSKRLRQPMLRYCCSVRAAPERSYLRRRSTD
jgi:DNA-binding NtrC family response regulator